MSKYIFRVIRIIAFFVVPLAVYGRPAENMEQLFYYSFDKKIQIEAIPGKFMLKKKPEVKKEDLESLVCSYLYKADFDWFNTDICTVTTDDLFVDDAIEKFLLQDVFESVRRVYMTTADKAYKKLHEKEPLALGFIDQIVLKYKDGVEDSVRERIAKSFDLTKCEDNVIFEIYRVSKDKDILNITNKLFETGFFEFAYPDLICKITFCDDTPPYPDDPYFQYQITLHNTGQTFNGHTGFVDADIDAPEAWIYTKGCENIVIAVIDQGVTSNHPDLPNSRQVRLNGSNYGAGDPNDPSPIGNNNHGNACAGVIAATANNGEGIAGVAPLCKIMPIRIDETTTAGPIANAIRFAANNGARIISNSWGYDIAQDSIIPAIINAINYAVNLNAIVVFAAGNTANHNYLNDNGYVLFPANQAINGKITVGASDRYDYQSDYSPSNSLIDVVAPSHRAYPYDSYYHTGIAGETLEMWSIDIPGNSGYNPWPSNIGDFGINAGEILPNSGTNYLSYTGHFGGTSHSCPVVAGIAALVLSMNPDLYPQTVCDIIKRSADKVGGYTYTNERCNEMGFGRVNAKNAVMMACDTTFISHQYFSSDREYIGCDVFMEDDCVYDEGSLKVKAKNNTIIKRDLYIEKGSKMEIIHYVEDF